MGLLNRLIPNRIKRLLGRGPSGKPTHARHLQRSTAYFDIGQVSDDLRERFEPLDSVPGWFNVDDFGHFSLVLGMQNSGRLRGDLLEIGSYHGRASAVMAGYLRDDERIVLCDAFDLVIEDDYDGGFEVPTPEGVVDNIKRVCPGIAPEQIVVHRCLSSDLDAMLDDDQRFRFIHVDGGHSEEQTFRDLALAHSRLLPGGILVVDDYHNPQWPTVTEGTDRYLRSRQDLNVLADLNRHGAQGRKLYLVNPE